jgi:hypothetical protein
MHLGPLGSANHKPGSANHKPDSANHNPESANHNPQSADHKPGCSLSHFREVGEKDHLLTERCWCAWKLSLLLIIQQFLKLMYSVCILIYVSMYLYSYPSTHGVPRLAADGAREQFNGRLTMTID